MIKERYKASLFVVMMTVVVACENDDGITVLSMEVPEDRALSAGTSTTFYSGSGAYDNEAPWVTDISANLVRFTRGDRLYKNESTQSTGLGPVYAGYSCESCHRGAGRTKPGVWTMNGETGEYGSGEYGFSSMLVYVTRKNGVFFQNYGRVLHDQSIYGVTAEGKLKCTWHEQNFNMPDGEPYSLVYPEYTITEWYANYGNTSDPIDPNELFCSVRIPLRHVGMGQMMALDKEEIKKLAERSNYPEYGISGRCNYVTEKGVYDIGLSGNKAQHQDLTVELGFSSDMGVTNSRYPEEICEGQLQMQEGSMMGLLYDKLEISAEDMEDVDYYLHGLGVPARRLGSATAKVTYSKWDSSESQTLTQREWITIGQAAFYEAKCHLCHVTTLHTRPRGATLLMGTTLPWLGGQEIHPYSDYLLHDMGSEIMGVGLNDNYVSGLARGNEWRTTPLWGVGLQQVVNGHTYFLHDGRARNFNEAIMWHGGEGEASKKLYAKMDWKKRRALQAFLGSL